MHPPIQPKTKIPPSLSPLSSSTAFAYNPPRVVALKSVAKTNVYAKRRNLQRRTKGRTIGKSIANHCVLRPGEKSLFVRQSDYWVVRYHGHAALFKSTRGLCYLAILLSEPGREYHVMELLDRARSISISVAANRRVTAGLYVGSPLLDAKAKAEYKRRVNDLRQELNEAERFNDPQRRSEVQNELQAISHHLACAVGLGSRDRRTSCDAERARSAATKSIKKAIQKIGDANPSLGQHLAARIKTGYFCSYNPHPDRPIAWKF